MPIRHLDIYDIVVDTVPGVLLVVSLLSLPTVGPVGVTSSAGVGVAVSLLVAGYVVGNLVRIVAGSSTFTAVAQVYDHVPSIPEYKTKSFQRAVDHYLDDSEIGVEFLRGSEAFFDLDLLRQEDGSLTVRRDQLDTLFFLVRNYVVGNEIGRSRRYLIGKTLFRSLFAVFVILFFVHGAHALIGVAVCSLSELGCPWSYGASGVHAVISVAALLASGLAEYRHRVYTETYGLALFNDFYTNVVCER